MSQAVDRSHLKPFCQTPRQCEVFAALEANGWAQGATAQALGVTRSSIRDVIRSVQTTASLPEGHRLKGVTRVQDPNGKLLKEYVKTERDRGQPEPLPPDFSIKRISLNTDGQGTVVSKWTIADKSAADRFEQFNAACEVVMARYTGAMPALDAKTDPSPDTLTVYPLGDPHIGMLAWRYETGEDFDLTLATKQLYAAVDMLVERAPASRVGMLLNLGDFFHAENDKQLTPTGGNKLDVDGRHAKVTEVGIELCIRMIDRLLEKHDVVRVVNVPGNHDPQMARMLALFLKYAYKANTRVIVEDNRNPYQYFAFGKVLLGFAHGDGAKHEALPSIMASEQPTLWGLAQYRLWLTGHIHHQVKKEMPGCVVESFRTMAPRDAWHHHKGYRAGQSLSAITYDPEYGELCRSTVDIRRVKASL